MTQAPIKITGYDPAFKQAFHDLNIRWLEEYFTVELAHKRMLDNPERELVADGGEVFFAVRGTEVLGTVGVRCAGGGVYELTKLAVSPAAQGLGLGRTLCESVIEFFCANEGKTLYLETHKKLGPALRLYESLNFKTIQNPGESHYDGCDLYMEWQGEV